MSFKETITILESIRKKIIDLKGDNEEAIKQRDILQEKLFKTELVLNKQQISEQNNKLSLMRKIFVSGLTVIGVVSVLAIIPLTAILAQPIFISSLFTIAKTLPALAEGLGFFCGYTILHANVIVAGLGVVAFASGAISLFAKQAISKIEDTISRLSSEQQNKQTQHDAFQAQKLFLLREYERKRTEIISNVEKKFDNLMAREKKSRKIAASLEKLPVQENEARNAILQKKKDELTAAQKDIIDHVKNKVLMNENANRRIIESDGLTGLQNLISYAEKPLREQRLMLNQESSGRNKILREQQDIVSILICREEAHRDAILGLAKLPANEKKIRNTISLNENDVFLRLISTEKNDRIAAYKKMLDRMHNQRLNFVNNEKIDRDDILTEQWQKWVNLLQREQAHRDATLGLAKLPANELKFRNTISFDANDMFSHLISTEKKDRIAAYKKMLVRMDNQRLTATNNEKTDRENILTEQWQKWTRLLQREEKHRVATLELPMLQRHEHFARNALINSADDSLLALKKSEQLARTQCQQREIIEKARRQEQQQINSCSDVPLSSNTAPVIKPEPARPSVKQQDGGRLFFAAFRKTRVEQPQAIAQSIAQQVSSKGETETATSFMRGVNAAIGKCRA